MAFDDLTRRRLSQLVTEARRVIEAEFTHQLQVDYGMDPASGEAVPVEKLSRLDDRERETARILRDTLAHYCAEPGTTLRSGLERIVREQAFTVLNRLAALRLAETRGIIVQSVGKGYQATGFQLYQRLAGGSLGETDDAYRTYLQSIFDDLSIEMPILFDRFSPKRRFSQLPLVAM